MKYRRGTTLYDYCVAEKLDWVLEQFDYQKNAPKTPKDFSKSSDKKIWFKYGECGHSCEQRIADKTGKRSEGCPLCLNRGGIGKSLKSEYPLYADMFVEEKNGIRAEEVSQMNGKVYWWRCNRCGCLFRGKVADVVMGHKVCNECTNQKRSFPEVCLGYYLKKAGIKREINKIIGGYKFDFYLPDYNIAIEYDGYPWHNSSKAQKNDMIKDNICEREKVSLMRIRDSRIKTNDRLTSYIWEIEYDQQLDFLKQFSQKIEEFFGITLNDLNIDIKRDIKEINNFKIEWDKNESLLLHMPQLKAFIDTDERNGNPEFVSSASHKIRFWLRHPKYKKLKWSMTAHDLFARKEPYTQWIKMCVKLIDRYPVLEEQVCMVGNSIREKTEFELTCDCNTKFRKSYEALIRGQKISMCSECLKKYRVNNLKNRNNLRHI